MQPGQPYGPPPTGYPPPAAYGYPPAPYGAAPYQAAPYGAAAHGAGGPFPGQPVPPQLVGAPLPPGLKIVRRPKVSASIALPLFGLFVAGLVCPTLPWADAGTETVNLWELMGNLWDAGGDAMKTFSANYFGWLWLVLVVWAFFLSMAGTLDNAGWRIVYGVLYTLIGLVIFGFTALSLLFVGAAASSLSSEYNTEGTGTAVGVVAVILLVAFVVFVGVAVLLFKLKGIGYRILAGLGLLSFALVHLSALLALPEGAELEPWAYLSIFGYFLCAVGCFIGPRYVPFYGRA